MKLLAVLLLVFVRADDNSTIEDLRCYYANGTREPNDYPCVYTPGACCPVWSICMSNGLCVIDGGMTYERHTCTDQTWQNSSCPHFCLDGNDLDFIA